MKRTIHELKCTVQWRNILGDKLQGTLKYYGPTMVDCIRAAFSDNGSSAVYSNVKWAKFTLDGEKPKAQKLKPGEFAFYGKRNEDIEAAFFTSAAKKDAVTS